MSAIEDILGKEPSKVLPDDIQNLINKKIEEGHHLDYKGPYILERPHELSKLVSAFLNTEGGLIVIGVVEHSLSKKSGVKSNTYPSKIEYVGKEFTKERVEQLIFSNIRSYSRPRVVIYGISSPEDPDLLVFLIDVPKGDDPPYQSADGKYYRRLNRTNIAMNHSEIAELFRRKPKPNLEVHCQFTKFVDIRSCEIRVLISNKGEADARHARTVISFENVEIVKVKQGPNNRIDMLRNNKPTLQWDNPIGIIHASHAPSAIWDLRLKVLKKKFGVVKWETYAEDMNSMEGRLVLLPTFDYLSKLDEGKMLFLPKWDDIFGNVTPDSNCAAK